jgi:hypothetical protein
VETEFEQIDFDLWKRLVKKMQVANCIYPGKLATEQDYQRAADLLNDLFTCNFKNVPGLRQDFYLLARVYHLETNIPREGPGDGYVNWDESRDRFLFLEFTKYTRLCLGLTTKKLNEVPTGIDRETVIAFFEFLFRNFRIDGFLPITRHAKGDVGLFFFNIRDGFDQVAEFLVADMGPRELMWKKEYSFAHVLLASPMLEAEMAGLRVEEVQRAVQRRTIGTPCVWIDVDENVPDLEAKLERYKIWPSIRVKTSPRGQHFFWILRKPAVTLQIYSVVDAQIKLAKLLGGDLQRCDFGRGSRIPGTFNFFYRPPHFVTFETSAFEYDFDDFVRLPYGFLNFKWDVLRGVYD